VDLNDLPADDPLWAEFLATPFALFPEAIGARP
jgi:hypothetical protein